MNKKLKVTISIIASMIIILGSAFTIYAATTEYSLKSHGIIAHDGDGDGAYTNTAKDIYIDSGDLKTINDAVVAGKTSLASAINSATASSATNKTTLGTTDANLPAFNDLKNAIANVKAAGNEEGIITGQNNVINNVGGKTSASLGADGSLTLSYDGTTGTSSVGNPTWAAIENKLSGKTDADGNPIYSGITDLDSLENAITADNDNLKNNIKKNPSAYGIESSVKVVKTGKGDLSIKMSDNGLTDYDVNHYILQITSIPSSPSLYAHDGVHHNIQLGGCTPTLSIDEENDTLAISGMTVMAICNSTNFHSTTSTGNWKLWHIE